MVWLNGSDTGILVTLVFINGSLAQYMKPDIRLNGGELKYLKYLYYGMNLLFALGETVLYCILYPKIPIFGPEELCFFWEVS